MPQRSLVFSLSLALLSLSPTSAIAQTITGTIVSVGDGDTIRVSTADKTLTVRLSCIDSPELKQQPYGQAAANRLKQLLPVGQAVTLQIADTDRYGRSVAKVYVGDTAINLTLVQEGQAVVYRQYLGGCPELRDRLLSAEAQDKQRRLGLWTQDHPVMPWDFRHLGSASAKARPQTQPLRTSLPGRSPALQANPSRGYNCSDFKTQSDAQRVYDANPGDSFKLDRDRDGIACESLQK